MFSRKRSGAMLRWVGVFLVVGMLGVVVAIGNTASPSGPARAAEGTALPTPTAAGHAGSVVPSTIDPELRPTTAPPAVQAAFADYPRIAGQNQLQQVRIPLPELLVYLPLVKGTGQPGQAPEPAPPADVWVTLRTDPSIRVARSNVLEYEVRVRNYGEGTADEVRVTLPYDNQEITFIDERFEADDDVVRELNEERVVLIFQDVEPDEDQRTARIFWAVNDFLATDRVIGIRASVEWQDARDGGNRRSNWAPVLVGDSNNSSPYVYLEVTPERAGTGAAFSVYTDRFIPDEEVTAWFNTPEGVMALERDFEADRLGRVSFAFETDGFVPARYEIVLFGTRSKLTAVSGFFVDPVR